MIKNPRIIFGIAILLLSFLLLGFLVATKKKTNPGVADRQLRIGPNGNR